MNKKMTLNTSGVSYRDACRLYKTFALAMDIHGIIAKFTNIRILGYGPSFTDAIKDQTIGTYDWVNLKGQAMAEIAEAMNMSHRMASSIRCSPAADLIVLTCRWFGKSSKALGDLQFNIGHNQTVAVHFLDKHLAKNIVGV